MKHTKRTTYLSRVQSEFFSRKWYCRSVTLFCNLLFTGQWMRKAQIVRCLVVEISEGGATVRIGKSQVPDHLYLVIGRFDILVGSIVVQRDPGHLHICFLKELRPDVVNRLARMTSPFGPKNQREAIIFAAERARLRMQLAVQKMMADQKVTVEELAKRLECSASRVEQWLSDDGNITARNFGSICFVLGYEAEIGMRLLSMTPGKGDNDASG